MEGLPGPGGVEAIISWGEGRKEGGREGGKEGGREGIKDAENIIALFWMISASFCCACGSAAAGSPSGGHSVAALLIQDEHQTNQVIQS